MAAVLERQAQLGVDLGFVGGVGTGRQGGDEPVQVVTMCANAPLTLMESQLAFPITQVAAAFTATPTAATATTMPPVTGTGCTSRVIASNATSALTTSSVMPFACADRLPPV